MTSVVSTKNSSLSVHGKVYIESFYHTVAAMRLTRWGIATSVLPYCRRYAANAMGYCHIYLPYCRRYAAYAKWVLDNARVLYKFFKIASSFYAKSLH
jgi:hypothetical protein